MQVVCQKMVSREGLQVPSMFHGHICFFTNSKGIFLPGLCPTHTSLSRSPSLKPWVPGNLKQPEDSLPSHTRLCVDNEGQHSGLGTPPGVTQPACQVTDIRGGRVRFRARSLNLAATAYELILCLPRPANHVWLLQLQGAFLAGGPV